jgi:hypothetical protein
MDLEADVVSSALQQHRKDSDLENRRCQATRISFIRNGRTNKFGWLQAVATKVVSISITFANPATIRIYGLRSQLLTDLETSSLTSSSPSMQLAGNFQLS